MSKDSVRLISLDGILNKFGVGANRSTVLDCGGFAGALITLAAKNCEIAGLFLNNYVNEHHIEPAASSHGTHIHHNTFWVYGNSTGAVPAIDFYNHGSGSLYIKIDHNFFVNGGENATWSDGIIAVYTTCTQAQVNDNSIIIGDGCVLTKGIWNQSYKGLTLRNNVSAIAGGGGATSTITKAISIAGGVANQNMMNVHSTEDLTAAGTEAAQGNMSGPTGGAKAAA